MDIAVRYGRGGWASVESEPLMRETLYPVASPEMALRLKGASVSEMLAMPLLHDSDLTGWRAWCGAHGVSLRPRARDRRFEDYTVVLAAAEAGLGIALVRAPLASEWMARSRLVRLSDAEVVCPLQYHVVTAKREKRPEVLEVIARLHALAREDART